MGPDRLLLLNCSSRITGLLPPAGGGRLPLSLLLLMSSAFVGRASQLPGMLPLSLLLLRQSRDILLLPASMRRRPPVVAEQTSNTVAQTSSTEKVKHAGMWRHKPKARCNYMLL